MRILRLTASLVVLCATLNVQADSQPPAPVDRVATSPDALSVDERSLVGLWSVDVDATWTALQAWADQHPGKQADGINDGSHKGMAAMMSPIASFQLRADRRMLKLGRCAESTDWRITDDSVVLGDEAENSKLSRFKLVMDTLVHFGGPDQSRPTVFVRVDLGSDLREQDLIGDWQADADSARAWAKNMDDATAVATRNPPNDTARKMIEASLGARTTFWAGGTGEAASADSQRRTPIGGWRIDGDLLVIGTPGPFCNVMRWTGKQLVGIGNSMMPGGIAMSRVSATPTPPPEPVAKPAAPAPKGD